MTDERIFDTPEFEKLYHCSAPLGAFVGAEGTAFRIWAPTAQAVTLRLLESGDSEEAYREIPMANGGRGYWSVEIPERLNGVFYDYIVTVDGASRRLADPYAVACGVNGQVSQALDLRLTDPEGWDSDRAPAPQAENVIYEVHVKDLTWDPASGVPEGLRGKFPGLAYGGGKSPVLEHIRSLGVTHVQLMPVFDYGSVDEAGGPDQFNWGYDPLNFNVPEGSYSTDPRDGAVRIRELKEAVMALHSAGLRVIMDVVYNHTYYTDSWLWRAAPWYYYRQHPDNSPSNGSGCGNDLASERSMCARYILDSVLFWAEEYHMDGFRFDLMGLMDAELMKRIRAGLDARYGVGEKLMLGEPWRADDTYARPGTVLADKDHVSELGPDIAVFNDMTRDAVKGDLWRGDLPGFVNGGDIDPEKLKNCLRGWAGPGLQMSAPSQTVNYLSCHDDWTLWDKLVNAAGTGDYTGCDRRLLRQNKLAAAMYMMCQGHIFMLSGEEAARTKRGVKNSYRSPMDVNAFDWGRRDANIDLVDWYRGLIALRKRLPGLTDKSASAGDRVLEVRSLAARYAVAEIDNSGDSPWDRLLIAFNAGETPEKLAVPEGKWQILVDGESSRIGESPAAAAGTLDVPPVSAVVLGRFSGK